MDSRQLASLTILLARGFSDKLATMLGLPLLMEVAVH